MRYTLTVLIFCLFGSIVFGQKFLQLEKVHSPKTRKYFPGDEITFQMVGGQWYTRVIEDISYEQDLVLFAKGHVAVDSMVAFRVFDNQKWSRPIGNQLINFAVVWSTYTLVDAALSDDFSREITRPVAYVPPLTSAGLGLLMKRLFKKRTFNLEKNKKGEAKRWRLRVLDLEVKKATGG